MKLSINYKLITLFVVIIIVICPILVYAAHSLPAADDYSNAGKIRECLNDSQTMFGAAVSATKDAYNNIGGYFFSAFLNYYFSPFFRNGITGVRVFNTIAHIFFFISAFFLTAVFSRRLLKINWIDVIGIYCIFIVGLANNDSNSEIYTWYVVLVAYVIPIAVMMVAHALFVLGLTTNKKLFLISAILAFLVSGSSLNISALNCGLLFIMSCVACRINGKKLKNFMAFIAALMGTLINLVAAGNFSRYGQPVASTNLIGSFKGSIVYSAMAIEYKLGQTPFLLMILIVLVFAIQKVDFDMVNDKFNHPIIVLAISFLGIVITNYPVILGTGSMSERCDFVQDIATYFLFFLWTIYLAGYIRKNLSVQSIDSSSLFVLISVAVLYLTVIIDVHGGINSFTTPNMISSIINGELDEYTNSQMDVLTTLENSNDKDIVISVSRDVDNDFVKDIDLRSDPDFWINRAMSRYYGLDSIRVISLDE